VEATLEGMGAGFFTSGTLSRRMVGVAGGMLNFLLFLKRFMIRNEVEQ